MMAFGYGDRIESVEALILQTYDVEDVGKVIYNLHIQRLINSGLALPCLKGRNIN